MAVIPLSLEAVIPTTPPEYTVRSAYAYPDYFTVPDGIDADTSTWEAYTPQKLTQAEIDQAMDYAKVNLGRQGHVMFGYVVWEKVIFEVTVPYDFCLIDSSNCWSLPEQICVAGACFPFAGQTIAAMYQYRFWYVSVPIDQLPQAAAYGIRPLVPVVIGIGAAIVLVIGALLAIGLIGGVVLVATGKVKWEDLRGGAQDVLKSPGQNVSAAITSLSWPMMALGFVIVASAFVLPNLVAKGIGAGQPGVVSSGHFEAQTPKLAGGGVTFGGSLSSGGAAPRR